MNKVWNIPQGRILYSDIMQPEKSLFSSSLCLSGKPDYIVETNEHHIVPVEVKTGNHRHPKPWHIMQLIAYCQLVSEAYQKDVPYGVLVYYDSKKQFRIPFNEEYRSLLSSTIVQMHNHMMTNMVNRNHTDEMKCTQCFMRSDCPERIDRENS